MTTTVAELLDDTRRHLYGMHRTLLNKLASSCDTDDISISLTREPAFGTGSQLGIDDELIYVYAADSSQKSAEIERARFGTTAAAHVSGAMVEVEPRFPQALIRSALMDEIRSWPPSVYKVGYLDLTGSSTTRALDLTGIGEFYNLLEVSRSPRTGQTAWTRLPVRLENGLSTTDFSSGSAIFLADTPEPPGIDIRVVYAAPFDTSDFSDAVTMSAIGLTDSMLDIPPLGAAVRLLAPREIKRTFTESQGESRRATEVPPGSTSTAAIRLKALRDMRLEEEARRLAYKYPMSGF